MGRNGQRRPGRPQIELTGGGPPSPEEMAAITGAIQQFLRDTSPPPESPAAPSPWLRAGLVEATGRAPWGEPKP